MKVLSLILLLASLAMAEVAYVELPNGLTVQDITIPISSTSKLLNEKVQSQLAQYNTTNSKISDEVYLVVLTEGGKPILPITQGLIQTNTNSHLSFVEGSNWGDIYAWRHVDHFINGWSSPNPQGAAFKFMEDYIGEPFFTQTVTVNRLDNPANSNYYNISTKEMWIVYEEQWTYVQQGEWITARLMEQAFRDEAFVDWAQFEQGFNANVATMVMSRFETEIGDSTMSGSDYAYHGSPNWWHGDEDNDNTFNSQHGSIFYQQNNVQDIATNCKNFAGRSDGVPNSGNPLIQEHRRNMCSMFWYKLFISDLTRQVLVTFNNYLHDYYRDTIAHYHFYFPPRFVDLYSWMVSSAPNNIEDQSKMDWLAHQYIIQSGFASNTYKLVLRSYIERNWSYSSPMSDICYLYFRGDSGGEPYEMAMTNEPIRFIYADGVNHNDRTFNTISGNYDKNGWVEIDISNNNLIPCPTSTARRYHLTASSAGAGLSEDIYDVNVTLRTENEVFGCVPNHDDGQAIITNIDTAQQWTLPVTNGCFQLDNFSGIGNPGVGRYQADYYWNGWITSTGNFNKDGGNFFLYIGGTGLMMNKSKTMGSTFYLKPPAPNPVTHSTVLNFSLAQPGHAQIHVYDISGRLVKVLLDGERNAGPQALTWDGTDSVGKPIANGVYTVMLSSSSGQLTKRVVVAR
jgi:hypothetical protein